MSGKLRFHLDEHMPLALAVGLRRRGIDVTTAADAGLLGAEDEKHIEFAQNSGRVIFTHDSDFLRMNSAGIPHAGIIYCKRGSRTLGQMLNGLVFLHRMETPEKMIGRVKYL